GNNHCGSIRPIRASLCASIRSFLRLRRLGPSLCRGSPPALHVRKPPRHPAPRPNASPLPSPLAPRPMTGTIPQSLVASSAALPLSTSPRPSPQCRSCSTCHPDPHPLSADLDWDQVDPAAALLLPSLLQIAVRVFDSALQPVLPSLLWHPAEPDHTPFPACRLDHCSSESCCCFFS